MAALALTGCGGSGPQLASIQLSPATVGVPKGLTQQLTASGSYSDGTTKDLTAQVTWSSSDPAVASVGAGGLVKGEATGSATVSASMGGVSATAGVTVSPAVVTAIQVAPPAPTVPKGLTQQMSAAAIYSDGGSQDATAQVAWSTSNAAVASIGAGGLVKGVAMGSASIGATLGTITGTATVTISAPVVTAVQVSPAVSTLPKGVSRQMSATATYSDASNQDVTAQVAWSTSNPAVASVSATGLVRGEAAGSASIGASLGGAVVSANVTVKVVTAIAVAPGSAGVRQGRALQLVATGTYADSTSGDVTAFATWTSGAPGNVSVSASGMAAAAPAAPVGGSAVITAAIAPAAGTSTITVTAAAPAIGPGVDNDPMLGQQWHLRNTSQTGYADTSGIAGNDIATAATYGAGYAGAGVKAAVVDTGLEIAHEDLAANVVAGSWNFLNSSSNPTSTATAGDHGTSVGGLVAAVRANGKGGMGVAPAAGLNGYNFISSDQRIAYFVASLGGSSANPTSNDVWVFNQSYGISSTTDFLVDPTVEAQLLSGVASLRGGKGALYVKAAGNGFRSFAVNAQAAACASAQALGVSCQNASMDAYNTLPYNVVVGALKATGVKSSYSTAGSAIWVSAPGGEYGYNASVFGAGFVPEAYQPAMVTTDQSGCSAGYSANPPVPPNNAWSSFGLGAAPNTSCNYTSNFNGTSSATPVTAGAIALILEANPALGWRDVKHILATTATQVDAARGAVTVNLGDGPYTAELPWSTNAAGHAFHNWYGFGRVNVDAALAMATSYAYGQLGNLADTGWIASPTLGLPIPNNAAAGVTGAIAVPANPTSLVIEAVQIAVTAAHPYTGDLGIELTSPQGTKSILLNIRNGFSGNGLAGMVLESNAFYGETSAGNWTIKVVDGDSTHGTGSLTRWQIRIYGH